MDPLQRRMLLGSIGSLGAAAALAGCIGDTPVTGNGDGDGGDGSGGGDDRLRGDAVVDYPGIVDDEVTVRSDERTIEYGDPEVTFDLLAMGSKGGDAGGNDDGGGDSDGNGVDGPDLRVSRDLSGEAATAFVAPVASGDDAFEFHVFANEAFVEAADWNVVTGPQTSQPESHDGLAFESLADGVYGLVVDTTSADVLLVTEATVEELDGGNAEPSGVVVRRDLEESVQTTAPNVMFGFEYDTDAERLAVMHEGGDSIEADRLEFVTEGSSSVEADFQGTVNAGTTATLSVPSSATVRIVWTSEEEGTSATLARWNGPDA